jgi:hypothetical protein
MLGVDGELGEGDDLTGRPGALEPGLGEFARVVDRLLLPGAVVGALADAVALRPPREVTLGIAPADTTVSGGSARRRPRGRGSVVLSTCTGGAIRASTQTRTSTDAPRSG